MFEGGGYPRGSTILVMGGPGTGKSIFGMQYLYYGALENDEPGVYITMDETPEKIRRNMKPFGWDIHALESDRKLIIVDAVSSRLGMDSREPHKIGGGVDVDSLISQVLTAVRKIDAKRLVVDSIAVLNLYSQSEFTARTNMLRLSNLLSLQDLTSLIITEAKSASIGITEFPPETFMFDGVIILKLDVETQERRISIRKMRGTKHVIGSYKFAIGKNGITLMP